MGKDKSEKKDKKEKKEKKRSETDGVHKSSKKEKKEKKLSDAAEKELTAQVLEGLEAKGAVEEVIAVDVEVTEKPIGALVPFANPLAEDKTAKKVFKTVKKAAVNKSLKRGVKEVVKALRKSPIPAANAPITEPLGVVILAADISPLDVISHIPILCEDHGVPYIFVTSRAELGAAGATKRPTSVVMVTPKSGKKSKKSEDGDEEDFSKVYAELVKLALKEQEKVKV
ncbi:snoRNA-binding protein [Talaromyces marneffei ATCC 18224]|uniref:H/ACA ribonucleoprotein complex subunit 2 n=2 Tax=Talaromyces marneffei TaxID=37727 RepID=B6QCG1_TALMQ|nr:uncharacterized protein EYB26_002882 [Talaromyces marneffei]EEA25615.1 small nuclear ribonucleoprotein complex protein Nhp2, putative [Talaromyces marneffei ATCC 18224]KAE8554330.1 hypothetical protein EYB25_002869 [Talaromyces marneffei]QGA15225.1 hypothetical protein EYB26_002882 [Talaromyces marneffei]